MKIVPNNFTFNAEKWRSLLHTFVYYEAMIFVAILLVTIEKWLLVHMENGHWKLICIVK